jgi:hypothetical protein
VIWVPTPDEVVQRMLRMAQVTANDYVVDLGAGRRQDRDRRGEDDGRSLARHRIQPRHGKHAQRNVEKAGVQAKAKVIQGDIFASDFTSATVITMYLLPALNMKLRPQILAMKPGTRVVSHSFNMEDWEPDETSNMDGRRAYLWIVPANVMGGWQVEMGGERADLTLEQKFQKLEGHVQLGVIQAGLREARLRGFLISFAYVDNTGMRRDFTGRVTGTKMEGSFRSDTGAEGRWTATKK